MRSHFFVAVLSGLSIGLAISQLSVPRTVQSQEAKGAKKPAEPKELDGLKASAAAFEKAYNAGDAKAIAAQFSGRLIREAKQSQREHAEPAEALPELMETCGQRRYGVRRRIPNHFSITEQTQAIMHHGDVTPEIAQGLLALKKRIDAAKIPSSKLDQTVNVAVWNLREFGKVRRTEAAIHFIAEILGRARRGSPDPAAGLDRRSPRIIGDLRSSECGVGRPAHSASPSSNYVTI